MNKENKENELIMVVPTNELFKAGYFDHFQGFNAGKEINFEGRMKNNYSWMKRGLAENNPEYKQPIAYSMILNPFLKRVFTYQRSKKDADYSEKRLQGKWSIGVGGHINKVDTNSNNPIEESFLRELTEEIEPFQMNSLRILGYINDDSNDVGKVHFGILYLIETDSRYIKPSDPEIDNGKFRTIRELEEIVNNPNYAVEEWTKIAIQPLKEYLKII